MMRLAGFPKASIEVAIARGQGVTAAGKPLESMLIEAVVPPSVAVVIDCQTDSKLRTLQEVRATIKYHEGALSPIGYMFNKRGRITFEPDERGRTADDVLDEALEAGAEDIETTDDGNIVVSRPLSLLLRRFRIYKLRYSFPMKSGRYTPNHRERHPWRPSSPLLSG